MAQLSRRLIVTAVTAALFVALGLVAPADRSGFLGPETAAAAALPQPGKRGKAVRALQERLVDASYLRAQYRTGYYGARTKKAVKALQRAHHLKATGRMTKATDRALTKAVAAMTKPRTWYHAEVIGTIAEWSEDHGVVGERARRPQPQLPVLAGEAGRARPRSGRRR